MITIDYIKKHQDEKEHIGVMKEIFKHFDDLFWADKYDELQTFMDDFCQEEICFQYYVSMLTASLWGKDGRLNRDLLIDKAIEVGTKEIGEKDARKTLFNLIDK